MTVAETRWQVRRAADVLRDGGVIVHATEAVFGLACRVNERSACARIAALKNRRHTKSFIVLAARTEQLAAIVDFDAPFAAQAAASWPGPFTWIFSRHPATPEWLLGPGKSVAVRVTAHPQAAALCAAVGPVVSTSANPAGKRPARDLLTARRYFGYRVDLYLPGKVDPGRQPSQIRDARTGAVVRPSAAAASPVARAGST